MAKHKTSFLQRLTGVGQKEEESGTPTEQATADWTEENGEAQLTVDVYQSPTEIVIQSMVAGVKPEDLDVDITREMVTIKGTRRAQNEARNEDFFYHELYWGTFTRSILLPQEVEVEKAEAGMKNGLLTIRLPKLNKEKTQSLKVKVW